MWFLLSLLSKSRHDSARCLSRCLPLRLGTALLTPTEAKRFHWEYSRARGYALTQVPYWTETLIFLRTVGNNSSSSRAAAVAIRTFPAQKHSTLPPASQWGQCCGIFSARKINKPIAGLGYSTLSHTPRSCTTAAKGNKLLHRIAFRKGGVLARSPENVNSSPSSGTPQRNNKSSVSHLLSPKSRV